MKEILRALSGFVALGSLAFADPTHPAPGNEEGAVGWTTLDREIGELTAGLQVGRDSGWTVLLRSFYTHGTKEVSTGVGGDDVSGFAFQDVDLTFWHTVGEVDFRASIDLVNQTTTNPLVEDAHVLFNLNPEVLTTLGQFKAPVFSSAFVTPENQLFIDRTAIGSAFDNYDVGVMAGGRTDVFDWATWVQNGTNGQSADHTYGFRVAWQTGEGLGHHEGARGKSDGLNGTLGFTFLNDDTVKGDNQAYGLDFNGNLDRFGFGLEALWLDDDFDYLRTNARDFGVIAAGSLVFDDGFRSNAFAHAVTASYAINDRVEVGIRSESMDNREETILRSAVLNFHRLENLAKFSLQWTHVDTTNGDTEGHYFKAGLSLGANR